MSRIGPQKRVSRIALLTAVGLAAAWSGSILARSTPQATAAQLRDESPDSRQPSVQPPASLPKRGMEIVQVSGYPELWVDGQPFFIHSAAFFYDRIPRDSWDEMLERYKRLGINTIDIYIPWNWHEPREGEFDFDGHTNPRRDLRALLNLIAQKGLRLIARPGPEILNEWRHGGYPGWLLDRPEYKMNPTDWIEGRYAPLDNLNAHNAEAAAQGWLDNATHMKEAAIWMAAVGKELAPYSANRMFHVKQPARGPESATSNSHRSPGGGGRQLQADPNARPEGESGPLLFVQVGDDFAIERTNYAGPAFWKYVQDLGNMLKAGGLDVPVFINPTDMRVSAEGSALDPPIGVMGQWYMHPRKPNGAEAEPPMLTSRDASEIELFTEELKTQPAFPPVMIEYQAGWYAPADDDRPLPNLPVNTLLSSRLLIANGIRGFNYFPLQDTFTPAGYSVPWANRSYRWDAALSPDGDPQPRIQAVRRNAQFLTLWGPLLAASHKRADFGIVYPLGAYPQKLLKPEDILNVSESVMRIEKLGDLSMISSELLDPEFQPAEQLLRDPILFLPVFDPAKPQFQLSSRVQRELVEYVRRGGTLVVFPAKPAGETIGELWRNAPPLGEPSADSAIRAKWQFGAGQVIESSRDFYSWISLDESVAAGRNSEAFAGALRTIDELFDAARVNPSLRFSPAIQQAGALVASEIVTDAGTGILGIRSGGEGFLSVTNLSDTPAAGNIRFIPPGTSARGNNYPYPSLHVDVPPHESLLLPLDVSACGPRVKDGVCTSTIPSAGAEFLGAQREGRRLNLSFYVPARAEVNLGLTEKPSHVWLDQTDAHPNSTWTPSSRELHITIPKGAAPNFRRTIKLELPNAPRLNPETNRPRRAPAEDLYCYVANSVLLPTSADAFLRTFPALVVPDADQKKNILLVAENRNEDVHGDIALSFEKPLHGPKSISVPAGGAASETIEFRQADLPNGGVPPPADHLFHTAIGMRAGGERRVLPVVFLLHVPGTEEHYRFDFDRDGADEWVLENDRLRLIVSPESGGRAIAVTAKGTGEDLATSVGLLRDGFSFAPNPPDISEARRRGRYGLSNRPYAAEWGGDAAHPVLRMKYDAPDVFPGGAKIEKSMRLEGEDGIRADYRVSLNPAALTSISESQTQSFVSVNSFPAQAADGSPTRFCWQAAGKNGQNATAPKSRAMPAGSGETCENFVPDGSPIIVPESISAVQIRSPGRTEVEVRWDCQKGGGRMTIEPKHFSALFRLEFPPLQPAGVEGQYSVHIRTLNAQ